MGEYLCRRDTVQGLFSTRCSVPLLATHHRRYKSTTDDLFSSKLLAQLTAEAIGLKTQRHEYYTGMEDVIHNNFQQDTKVLFFMLN